MTPRHNRGRNVLPQSNINKSSPTEQTKLAFSKRCRYNNVSDVLLLTTWIVCCWPYNTGCRDNCMSYSQRS